MAKFALGFDMRVIGYDPYISDEVFRRNGAKEKYFEELLAECDVLSVHVPLNKETKGMITEIELKKMRKGSIVLNAARWYHYRKGLLQALNEGYIAGAGIDTFDNEPKANERISFSPQCYCYSAYRCKVLKKLSFV